MKSGLQMENLEFKLYEGMGHEARLEELDDVVDWLLKVLPERLE